ncbi:MAG: tryptophan transporter [Halanaerobium sp.]|nr:tryptophan transporter [Halanaerobium sp.]
MKLRTLVEVSLLLAVGFILHSFFPPILFGMKPDFSLAMLFAVIILHRDWKIGLLAAAVTGIFTALTTGFPGGQIANPVDKMITGTVVITAVIFLGARINDKVLAGLTGFFATLLSGVIFLSVAKFFLGFSGQLGSLIAAVVLPAALINTFTTPLLVFCINVSKRALSPLVPSRPSSRVD